MYKTDTDTAVPKELRRESRARWLNYDFVDLSGKLLKRSRCNAFVQVNDCKPLKRLKKVFSLF